MIQNLFKCENKISLAHLEDVIKKSDVIIKDLFHKLKCKLEAQQ